MINAVILLGGESSGTRFRPLSLDLSKPLFPLGGHEMVYHQIKALSEIVQIRNVFLLGYYEKKKFSIFI